MSRRGMSFGGGATPGQVLLARTYWWTWSGAAARTAQSVTAADVGTVGYQQDIALGYQLVGVSPTRWAPLADPSMGPPRYWFAIQNNAAISSALGLSIVASTGTTGARAQASTTRSTRLVRVKVETAAGAGSVASLRHGTGNAHMTAGGIRRRYQFVLGDVCASMRWFVGLNVAGMATNLDPSAALNVIGLGTVDGSANVHLVRGDGSAAAAPIDLGASFPSRTLDIGYDFDLYSIDGTTSYGWQARHLDSDAVASGLVTTSLPTSTSILYDTFYSSNNADAEVISLDPANLTVWQRAV
jgi:hypothetical protein